MLPQYLTLILLIILVGGCATTPSRPLSQPDHALDMQGDRVSVDIGEITVSVPQGTFYRNLHVHMTVVARSHRAKGGPQQLEERKLRALEDLIRRHKARIAANALEAVQAFSVSPSNLADVRKTISATCPAVVQQYVNQLSWPEAIGLHIDVLVTSIYLSDPISTVR